MDNKAMVAGEEPQHPTRPLEVITAEINYYKAQTVQNIIEIGHRLIEAKKQVPHGEWGQWLKEHVEFGQNTASRIIRISINYSNSSLVTNLTYSKLLALLQIPADEREDFMAQPHEIDGEEKTVAEMTKRELQEAIKARDEATHRVSELQALSEQRKTLNETLQMQLKQARSRPIELAVREPSATELDTLRQQAEEDIEAEYRALMAEKERTIGELEQQLRNAPAPEPLPIELVRGARLAFEQSVLAAYQVYSHVVLCMEVSRATDDCEYCIDVCNRVLADLRNIQARAFDLQMQDESLELDDFDGF